MEKRKRQMNLLYIPAVLLMACFVLYPLARGIYISFFKWNGYSQNMTFIGLKNYLSLLSDKYFKSSFWNTMLYGFGSALLQNVFGLRWRCSSTANSRSATRCGRSSICRS